MKYLITIFTALLFSATISSAAVLNFALEADMNGERGLLNGSTIVNMLNTGKDVTFNATGGYAYLDSGNAGLGVCALLSRSAQCIPSSDDNVTAREAVYVDVSGDNTISSGFFRTANHGKLTGDLDYSVDGGTNWLTANVLDGLFDFGGVAFDNIGFKYTGKEFYVSSLDISAVPIPAGFFLLAGALSLLGLKKVV
jgi:hypothetical protein